MLVRLTHAAIAFAVTAVLYQAYVLAVAPFVEPRRSAAASAAEPGSASPAPRRDVKYRELFAAYFPDDHWTLHEPKTLDNGQVVAALEDYEQTSDGKIRITRCVLLFFPSPRDPAAPPPHDAVVIEAPEGAVLQLDSPAGLSAAWGEIQYGQLEGPIEIRSNMQQPGKQDDLHIWARDIRINDDLLRTAEPVEVKLGPHFARGRKLEIRLLPRDRGGSRDATFGNLESLEITHDVYVQLAPQSSRFVDATIGTSLPAESEPSEGPVLQRAIAGGRPSAGASVAPPPPLRIVSRGPFTFDFANYVASFSDEVRVRQLHPGGVLDELAADQLNLYFDPTSRRPAATAAGNSDARSPTISGLEPASIEAKGGPFQLRAPSRSATAAGERLWLEIPQRRITIEGGEEVRLAFQGYEIRAPLIQYEHPSREAQARLGTLLAAGGGRLWGTGDAGGGPLEVRWGEQLRIDRRNGQPVLSLWGRPWISLAGVGQMWSDRLELALVERPQPGEAADALPWDIAPDRLAATGHVAIESQPLAAETERLDVGFRYPPSKPSAGDEPPPASGAKSLLSGAGETARRRYAIKARRVDLQMVVRDRKPHADQITAAGEVTFRETSPVADAADPSRTAPLSIRAAKLQIDNADSPEAVITIDGASPSDAGKLVASAADRVSYAEIVADGATLRAPTLLVQRGQSHAAIEAPGEMELPVDRDFSGRQLDARTPLTIRWEESLRLAGNQVTFSGNVLARHAAGWLQTPRLVIELTDEVRFDASQGGRPEPARFSCPEGVYAEFSERDAEGLTARRRFRLESLLLDQLTGAIEGQGPGRLQAVEWSPAAGLWPEVAPQASADDAPPGQKLRYLGIEFTQGVKGNLRRRNLRLLGNVRTVYGPVDSWQQRLEMLPSERPGPQTLWITCDELLAAESPLAVVQGLRRPSAATADDSPPLGPIELAARGHVVIEGEDPRRGAFTARGDRASYDEIKSLFVLEGNAWEQASITHQQFPGAPFSTSSARKLTYHRTTGQIHVEKIGRIELNQLDMGSSK